MTVINIPAQSVTVASDPAIGTETLRAKGVEVSLAARLTALENGTVVVPPPVIPPVVPPPVVPPPTTGLYGPAMGGDTLANTQVGGQSGGNGVSLRFRATGTQLQSVRFYVMCGSGYGGGSGGTLRISVQADNNGLPSGTSLATASVATPNSGGYFPLVSIAATLTVGSLYHIVFVDVDGSPSSNFISINALYTYGSTISPRTPKYPDTDWALLLNAGGWSVRSNFIPILDLGYSNGHAGQGYMESWIVGAPASISGSKSVRELFNPPVALSVSELHVRLMRVSGSSPLTIRLEKGDGTVLGLGTVSGIPSATPGQDAGGSSWASVTIPAVSLSANSTYHLVVSCPSDTVYSAFPLERGSGYGFDPATYFNDGYGQYTTDGSSWSGFKGQSNADLEWYVK